jgi:hypothetical protein
MHCAGTIEVRLYLPQPPDEPSLTFVLAEEALSLVLVWVMVTVVAPVFAGDNHGGYTSTACQPEPHRTHL